MSRSSSDPVPPLPRAGRRLVLLAGAALVLAGCSASSTSAPSPTTGSPSTATSRPTGSATRWGAPSDVPAAVAAAGLTLDSEEHLDVHYHAHLDVIVDGRKVTVPAGLGIDEADQTIAALHTHDATGVLHVESAAAATFTLGQVLALWGLPHSAGCINGLCPAGGRSWTAYVDGTPVAGDPAAIVLGSLQEIALVYGVPGRTQVPGGYDFAGQGITA